MADKPVSTNAPIHALPNPLARFPQSVRDEHARFLSSGDVAALDTVVLAVVRRFQSKPAELPDSARLIGDLGFDSLTLAEIVFFLEDLYQVSITNEELMSITTIGELRAFIRVKVAATRSP